MNHFQKTRITSPLLSICVGYSYMFVVVVVLYTLGFYEKSPFFRWGTPVTFMSVTITDSTSYYGLLALFFGHQLINNWVNNVTYPWIMNCVQDPKNLDRGYSKKVSMIIVNMFALYSELDMILVVSGIVSQVTFFLAVILANVISVSIINWEYLRDKRDESFLLHFTDEI